MISLKRDKSNSILEFHLYDVFRWTSSGDFIECSADYVQMSAGSAGTSMVPNPTRTDVLTGVIDPVIRIETGVPQINDLNFIGVGSAGISMSATMSLRIFICGNEMITLAGVD